MMKEKYMQKCKYATVWVKKSGIVMITNKCVHVPLGGSKGSIYRVVRGLIYIAQTVLNHPANHAE
jgi:hypothetical protein